LARARFAPLTLLDGRSPAETLSDGPQALLPDQFAALMQAVPAAAAAAR